MKDVSPETLTDWGERFVNARYPVEHDNDEDMSELTEMEEALIGEVEEQEGFTLAGYGESRIVFEIDSGHSVLFARNGAEGDDFTNGRLTNGNESHIWNRLSENDMAEQFNLIPIIDSHENDLWVVKPNITSVAESDPWVAEAWEDSGKENLWENLQPLGDHVHLMEIQSRNVCVWNGSFYLFDYGTSPPELEESDVETK